MNIFSNSIMGIFLGLFFLSGFTSELDQIIPAEIKNDSFYQIIYNLAKRPEIQTILEIGSSSGEGSTEAFVKGITENSNNPKLFCMEVSKVRFQALQTHYKEIPNVICYNVSSVPLNSFPSKNEVLDFLSNNRSLLSSHSTHEVLRWLQQDIDYIIDSGVDQHGIDRIKKEHQIKHFDMVLIDGSEFTGFAELQLVYGAKFILLDDIGTFKNWYSFKQLRKDRSYRMIAYQASLRHGFAVFQKI